MKIVKTTTPLDTIEYDGDYPVNLDPVDVVEIFKTPLVGSYNWDYTVQDNRIKKLYAASQTFDEARHVECFNKYIQTRLQKSWPISRALKGLLAVSYTHLTLPTTDRV